MRYVAYTRIQLSEYLTRRDYKKTVRTCLTINQSIGIFQMFGIRFALSDDNISNLSVRVKKRKKKKTYRVSFESAYRVDYDGYAIRLNLTTRKERGVHACALY